MYKELGNKPVAKKIKERKMHGMVNKDGPWPDPSPTYFWPAVNKGLLTSLWPRYFLTWPDEIFWPIEENFFLDFSVKFSRPKGGWPAQPEQQKKDPTHSGVEIYERQEIRPMIYTFEEEEFLYPLNIGSMILVVRKFRESELVVKHCIFIYRQNSCRKKAYF